ncbi:sigma-54-dependent transcriptional regulator [Jiella marina]|uniref:sigma-54-dependent transcriptional regulator n=1 Tax=Jiella sp. LLJ827 TaxID=2917712 RepID=UPI0021006EF8|nr:sigma-54 dependent transcriptional regulator [Jiella sp. LLJ827]MCQ0990061.1 sigma-54 dependent transcriptional regulator [Jiella sp. LLJ827]
MTEIVLIVDDDPIQRRLLDAHISRMGLQPLHCDGGRAAINALGSPKAGQIAAVVLDLMMPDKSGMEVMAEMRRNRMDVPIIVQTAKGSIDTVVEAMRTGAFDFVVKPVAPERFRQTLANAVRMHATARPSQKHAGISKLTPERMSPIMAPVLEKAAKAARSNIPILIGGETGVGKEWLARAIQSVGERAEKPFVTVNCGALPSELVESILFGHAKGAFTDATQPHGGKFLEADGGTLFLDEVGELAPAAQVKLLRVLQEGEIDPVGASKPLKVDVRLISATNRDLGAAVADGRFREDLYYRLNAFEITVPPLRDRRSEIGELCRQFLARLTLVERASPVKAIDAPALELLQSYDWPGNIRQLENVLHRAVVLGETEMLGVEDFPQIAAMIEATERGGGALGVVAGGEAITTDEVPMPQPSLASDSGGGAEPAATAATSEPVPEGAFPIRDTDGQIRRIVDVEADLIRLAVDQYDGRMSEIARRLGIGRSTLYRKMREYKIADR